MDDLNDFCCLNRACSDYGRRDAGNLRVGFRDGPGKPRRLLVCRTCQKRFSERDGTPLFDCRLPEATAVDVPAHLQDGVGGRKTGRPVRVSKNTVSRPARAAGRHAPHVHDERVAFSPSGPGGPV